MDALLAKFAITSMYEKFTDTPAPPAPAPPANKMSTVMIIAWVVWGVFVISFGSAAAWLSWESNTLAEWNSVAKGVFAFFSFFAGFSYLVVYFIHKLDLVMALRACKRSTGGVTSVPKLI